MSRGAKRADELLVLTYHKIAPRAVSQGHQGLISATPSEFAKQIDWLTRNYNVVSLDLALQALRGASELPRKSVLLTFDDAVDDFAEHAFPVLERCGAPSAVFVPTSFAGDADAWFWWDAVHAAIFHTERRSQLPTRFGPLNLANQEERTASFRLMRQGLKSIPFDQVAPFAAGLSEQLDVQPPPANVMDWITLRGLSDQGVAICPHTRTHAHLDQLPTSDVIEEVEGSISDVRDAIGHVPPVFAYPTGQRCDEAERVLQECGIEMAFTTQRGLNHVRSDHPLRFARVNIGRRGLALARLLMSRTTSRPVNLAVRRQNR